MALRGPAGPLNGGCPPPAATLDAARAPVEDVMPPADPARPDPKPKVSLGYSLSTEEHRPEDLVEFATRAEAAGFEYASISDHFHPWIEAQGNSPFVWSVLGGIANATSTLRVGTGVTCPTVRYHPAIVA